MAEELGITKRTLYAWEVNSRTPEFEILSNPSDIFQRSIEYIMVTSVAGCISTVRREKKLLLVGGAVNVVYRISKVFNLSEG